MRKTAFWSYLVGAIFFFSGLTMIILGWGIFGSKGIYETIGGIGFLLCLIGIVGLMIGYGNSTIANKRA